MSLTLLPILQRITSECAFIDVMRKKGDLQNNVWIWNGTLIKYGIKINTENKSNDSSKHITTHTD